MNFKRREARYRMDICDNDRFCCFRSSTIWLGFRCYAEPRVGASIEQNITKVRAQHMMGATPRAEKYRVEANNDLSFLGLDVVGGKLVYCSGALCVVHR